MPTIRQHFSWSLATFFVVTGNIFRGHWQHFSRSLATFLAVTGNISRGLPQRFPLKGNSTLGYVACATFLDAALPFRQGGFSWNPPPRNKSRSSLPGCYSLR